MTCTHCDRARAGMWHGFAAGCADCQARAAARSPQAFAALHPRGTGDRHGLRELIRRAMPDTDLDQARRMVWAWWQHDQSSTTTNQAP